MIDPRLVAALEGHLAYPYQVDLPRMAVYPERHRLMRVWSAMFASTPVVVTPVWPDVQFPGDADLERGIDFIAHMLQFATPAPLLGLPSLAVPTGVVDGLPTGVQIHADRWNDVYALDAGRRDRVGGRHPRPPRLSRAQASVIGRVARGRRAASRGRRRRRTGAATGRL